MDYKNLAVALAGHIRDAVKPHLGELSARTVTGTASSGDATFSIDDIAEDAVTEYIEKHGVQAAYYTEDGGVKEFGTPEIVLIIDPVDGSRGAIAGFEMCVVSVAIAKYSARPKLKDVVAGCVYEIKEDRIFVATDSGDCEIIENGKKKSVSLLDIRELTYASWTSEFAARPAHVDAAVLTEAIDASSLRGGFFVVNSTAWSLTRMANAQLSAVVDIGKRMLVELPSLRPEFEKAGFGQVLGLFPYDIAAAYLIANNTGCTITDSWGNSLDDIDLYDTSEANILSIIAASTPELHSAFLQSIDNGFEQYKSRL